MSLATKEAQREYQREWIAKRRTAFFSDKSCAQCSSTEDLQLDHIDKNQKISHRIWSWSRQRRESELEKCQVLCGACHKKKTFSSDIKRCPHGSRNRYDKYGCRCEPCKAAKKTHNAKKFNAAIAKAPSAPITALNKYGQPTKAKHGGRHMYRFYKCRCEACINWSREQDLRYRIRFDN